MRTEKKVVSYQCDRCKRTVKETSYFAFLRRPITQCFLFMPAMMANDASVLVKDLDLCKTCQKSFAQWLSAGNPTHRSVKREK